MNSSVPIPTNKELQAVKDIIASFLVSLKNYGLYPENHNICQKCFTIVFERLKVFLNNYDRLRLDIEKERLIYKNEIVFQETAGEENLAFFLYRDGIRWVEFNKGLNREEIKGFLTIINCYKTVQEDPEGDLVTALWEAHFPSIRYKASDIYWDSEPLLELNLLRVGDVISSAENVFEGEEKNLLSPTLRASEKGLFKLNAGEIEKLRGMIVEEENRDIVKDLLDLVSVLLKDQGYKEHLEALLQFVKDEIKVALAQENFQLAYRTISRLHKMRLTSKNKYPWVISIFNNFIKSISEPNYLNVLSKILTTLDQVDLNRFKLMRRFLMLLHSNAILTLGPILSQVRNRSIQQQLLKIIDIMARRDLQPLEQLLSCNDVYVVRCLVYIAGHIPSKKAHQILLKMIHNPSEIVRKQAIKQLIAQESVPLEIIFPFVEDSDKSIRQLILDYLKQNKTEKAEELLIKYLQQKRSLLDNQQHIIDCYKTLGKCGSSKSIPFLKKLLFKRRWLPDFRGLIHRQGSVIALMGLETKEAGKLLQKASRSFFPNVRIAYKKGLKAVNG